MRLLIVQLSDMHCTDHDYKKILKIDQATTALKTLGDFDGALLVFCGDITDTASKNEYSVGRSVLGRFVAKLGNSLDCGFIPILIVPGNHDMSLPDDARGIDTILSWEKSGTLDIHMDEELQRLSEFYKYANSKNCFNQDRICDVRKIKIAGKTIQACLLNSAPYSTRRNDDKQTHYFPTYVEEKLARDNQVDLKITIMHHSYEWCEWSTKTMLRRTLLNDDIVFFGHDHNAEAVTLKNGDGSNINMVLGGKFSLDLQSDCAFNAVVYDDSAEKSLITYKFTWYPEQNLFVSKVQDQKHNTHSITRFSPTEEYLDKLLIDTQRVSKRFTDYYVLPKLEIDGDGFCDFEYDQIGVDKIFVMLQRDGVVAITGDTSSGKSALLKYLYFKSISRGFMPLFIEKRDYKDSRIDKMFRDMFELQYGDIEHAFDVFAQSDINQKIVFVDDFDLIDNAKARENLFDYIIRRGGLLVYSTDEITQPDLTLAVKEKLRGDKNRSLHIKSFYKETRDQLISNICSLVGHNGNEEKTRISGTLDYLVQVQAGLFSLSPENLIQYIKFYLNGDSNGDRGIQTFNVIFETNIRDAIIQKAKGKDVTIYLTVLEFLAYNMYFILRSSTISISQLEELVQKYNQAHRGIVVAKLFLETCKAARILEEGDDSFNISFCNNNTFAYFVAKYINRELERDPTNLNNISYVMNNICFGINDTIILFLSYIRSNTKIIINIAQKAEELIKKYPELNFDQNNMPFLKKSSPMADTLPTAKERKEATQETEKIEKIKQENIKFRGIFDYKEEDSEKENYRIVRSLKYVQLIGRALSNQYGSLTGEEIDIIVKSIYSLPQKIIYGILKPYADHYEEIIADLKKFVSEVLPDKKIGEKEIRQLFNDVAMLLTLNIMNDIAFNSADVNTIRVLNEYPMSSSNYAVENLMMTENAGNSEAFISKTLELFKKFKDDPFIKKLISIDARKHIMCTPELDHHLIDKLISGGVLSPAGKRTLLLEKLNQKGD